MLRAWSPERKRCVPLAAPRQVDIGRARVGNTPLSVFKPVVPRPSTPVTP
jgi:hypothetical protein